MKNLSIRLKITLWYSFALIVVVAFTFSTVLFVSNQVIQKTVRDNLIETVESNITELQYFATLDEAELDSSAEHFIRYEDGYLSVDTAFLDSVNEVYSALYTSDGSLLYGENPIARDTVDWSFQDTHVQKLRVNGTLYFIYDRELTREGLEGLWLRGVVAATQGGTQLQSVFRLTLILLPMLVILAIIGGYLIARRALRPIQKLSATAAQISEGDDLKQRIDLGKGRDELHELADSFNGMFARLDASFEAQRQFTSDASHELRTPMSVIMAQCEFSLEEPRSEEDYRAALEVIQRQGRKMNRLIRDMLDFARLESHSGRYTMQELDLTELVNAVCADLALLRERNITLTWEAEAEVTAQGNRELLTRLLVNLVSNAYRYGRENGHTHVTLQRQEKMILLSVADDGIGIPEEEQEKIFRRFYQSDRSRSEQGAGLGLAMVREIAQFHGGEIRVESVPDEGSTFTFSLPAKK